MCRVATLVCALAVASIVPLLAGSARAQQSLAPSHQWEGEFSDEKLKQEVPKGGVITDADGFAKLWKAWRPNEAVPAVDFKKQFAFVATCSTKGERPVPWATLQGGALSVSWDAARRGRGGWGYAILTFDRNGVKAVNRVELVPATDKPEGPGK
jgi:hypothetical protein